MIGKLLGSLLALAVATPLWILEQDRESSLIPNIQQGQFDNAGLAILNHIPSKTLSQVFPASLSQVSQTSKQDNKANEEFCNTYNTQVWSVEGERLYCFRGRPVEMSPNGHYLLTKGYIQDESNETIGERQYVWAIDQGTEVANFTGNFFDSKFLPDSSGVVITRIQPSMTMSNPLVLERRQPATAISDLFTLEGEKIASLPGSLEIFSPDKDRIITVTPITIRQPEQTRRIYLWTMQGEEVASFEGSFAGITDDHEKVVIQDNGSTGLNNDSTILLNISGQKIASYEGIFKGFTQAQDGLVTVSNSESTTLWDLSGQKTASYEGVFVSFTKTQDKIITTSFNEDKTTIWTLDGTKVFQVKGFFISLMPSGDFITSSTETDTTYIWDNDGNQKQAFLETALDSISLTTSGDKIAIEPPLSRGIGYKTFIYSTETGANLLEVTGYFQSFTPDEDGVLIWGLSNDKPDLVQLWDFSGELKHEFLGYYRGFLSDTEFFTAYDNEIYLWSLDGTKLATFEGFVKQLSPDKQKIVTTGRL
jgi:hypothetical protein